MEELRLKYFDFSAYLKRQEFRNSVWNVADVILLPLLMLIVTPYFIYRLGAEQYGIWMLVNSIMVSIGIINLGIGDASIKFVSKYKSLNSKQDIRRITNAGFLLTIILLLAVFIIGLLIAFIMHLYNPFNIDADLIHMTVITIILGSTLFGLKQTEQFNLSIFRGFERYDTSSIISMISKFLLLSAQFIIVFLGYSLIEIFIWSVITLFIIVLGELLFIKSHFSYIPLIPRINRKTLKEIFSFSTWSWIQSVLSILVGQADKFVVITLAGPAFLAYYSLASTIGSQIHSLFTAAVSWVFPKISSKTERKEEISKLYYKMQFIMVLGGLILISPLILFGDSIFKLWLGDKTYGHSILLIRIFLFYIFVNLLSIIPHFTLFGANHIKKYTYFVFISVILTISSMFISYYFIGVVGLAYGKLFAAVFYIPMILVLVEFLLIRKNSIVNGLLLYLPNILVAIAIYISNSYSVLFVIPALLLLIFNYRTKILIRNT